jgi:hypothetical protein
MIRLACIAVTVAAALVGVSAPAAADPQSDLTVMLPAGYGSESCAPVADPVALAAVTCSENSLPGGPTSATYWLFADHTSMSDAFTAILSSPEWTPVTCPGESSPGQIPLQRANGTTSGSVACRRAGPGFYTSDRDGAVVWTRDADLFVGLAYVGYRGQAYPVGLFDWIKAWGV